MNRRKVQEFVRSLSLLMHPEEVVQQAAKGVQDLFRASLVLLVQFDPERGDFVVLAEVRRINRTVEGLLSLSPVREPRQIRLDILRLLEEALLLVETQARPRGIAVEKSYARDQFPVQGDPDQLKQIFLNLLLNASDAVGEGGTIHVRATTWGSLYDAEGDRRVQIEISDNGCGIPPEEFDRVFDPFFTTKLGGSGLGLAICQSLVERNGGQIDLESEAGMGTTVRVRFR